MPCLRAQAGVRNTQCNDYRTAKRYKLYRNTLPESTCTDLYGIADIDLTRLQHVQNQLAILVTKSPPFTRSIPLLRSLHWLPVRFRILFKINLFTYRTLREKQPVYVHSMLAASIPSSSPRSNNNNRLLVPRVKTNTGARAFHSCAPSLWNNLPLSLCLSPIDTVTSHDVLMLRNCFLDFAVEHWFGCRATEPGFAGDIGVIEVSLIDWLIDIVYSQLITLWGMLPFKCQVKESNMYDTVCILLLNTLVIIGLYDKQLTKSYTAALKCTFQIIPLL